MGLNDFGTLANIIVAFVAIVSISVLFIQLRQNDRSLRYQVLQGLVDILEESTEQRKKLEKLVYKDKKYNVLVHKKDHSEFRKLIRTWDKVAAFTKYKAVPRTFVLDFYSRHIVRSWEYLEPLVTEIRKKRGQPLYRSKFQVLAILAVKHRKKKYSGEKFPEIEKPELEWKEWKKVSWFLWK